MKQSEINEIFRAHIQHLLPVLPSSDFADLENAFRFLLSERKRRIMAIVLQAIESKGAVPPNRWKYKAEIISHQPDMEAYIADKFADEILESDVKFDFAWHSTLVRGGDTVHQLFLL